MRTYSLITLRPDHESDRKDFNDFRKSDIITLFKVLFFALLINNLYEMLRYLYTFDQFENLALVTALTIIQILATLLNSRFSAQQNYIISATFALQELVNLVYWWQKMAKRDLDEDSGKDSELYSREQFHIFFTYYVSFLCQDTKFLLLWFTPIYSFKFFILLHGTDTTLLLRG